MGFRHSFADLSQNLRQNIPAIAPERYWFAPFPTQAGNQKCKCRRCVSPCLQGSGVGKYVSAQACLQEPDADFFFRELYRRSFVEGFQPRRMVTEYMTPCKDLLINPHIYTCITYIHAYTHTQTDIHTLRKDHETWPTSERAPRSSASLYSYRKNPLVFTHRLGENGTRRTKARMGSNNLCGDGPS